jgi:hypothetical protein
MPAIEYASNLYNIVMQPILIQTTGGRTPALRQHLYPLAEIASSDASPANASSLKEKVPALRALSNCFHKCGRSPFLKGTDVC